MPRRKKDAGTAEANAPMTTGDIPKTEYLKSKCVIIGKNIRDHRKQRRFSVEDLAQYLKLSISYIGLLERGDRCPSLKIVFKICDLFGITPDGLLTAPDDDPKGGFKMAEDSAEYNTKTQIDTIVSLIRVLQDNELEFVIDTIKNLKKIGK
ncbi:MAG: helix-turn-helix transcriptional regulator [Clostridiales bacterium]|jgi:transcriptional regulator with XRE-family HTH domain|nr:helix-turn-helix transcriptional regulator [Clostridiales bacterium]